MRVIFHLDFDAYFVSAARTVDPTLEGKPVVVARGGNNTNIVATSYEAKKRGVKLPMLVKKAKELIPELIVVNPNHALYTRLSTQAFELIANHFTRQMEVSSIDECYIDVTDIWQNYQTPYLLAKAMQNTLKMQLNLPCSIGIANNKFVAKMATPLHKPFGITVIKPTEFLTIFADHPIEHFHGIGRNLAPKLRALGIKTIKDLAMASVEECKLLFGKNAELIIKQARGEGSDLIEKNHNELKGLGHEVTLTNYEHYERQDILKILGELVRMVINRLENRSFFAQTVVVTFKIANNQTLKPIRKQKHLNRPIGTYDELLAVAIDLFDQIWTEGAIKFVGLRVFDLVNIFENTYQTSIFDSPTKCSKVEAIIESVNLQLASSKQVVTLHELQATKFKKQVQSRFVTNDRVLKYYEK